MEWAADLVRPAVALLAAAGTAWLVAFAIQRAVRRKLSRSDSALWPSLRRRCRIPFRISVSAVALLLALPYAGLAPGLTHLSRHVFVIVLILSVAWLVIALILVAEDVALSTIKVDIADNLRPRKLRTQITVFRRVFNAIIGFVALAAVILSFPAARAFGASLLVSAGVFGVVAGIAAQSTLANVIAGLQIAMSDPLRIDDVVVVNGEWGRIEEVTLTYVVVRTWDNRALILPISWFTQNAFENWTRHEARVLGSIVLHVDFTVPVEELRAEMYRLVERSPLWDGRDWVLQVVDTTPSTMVLRGLVSSADAPSNWDLRCDVREMLLKYLQTHHPETLPKVRADVSHPDGRWSAGAGTKARALLPDRSRTRGGRTGRRP